MLFVGIDPGKNGAMAVILREKAEVYPLKTGIENLATAFLLIAAQGHPTKILIEKVHAMPGQGVTSMFNFGRNFGQVEGLMAASLLKFDYVTPQAWQKEMGLLKKSGENGSQKKNRHKKLAQELFPGLKVTHTNADALLIAEYCRRIHLTDQDTVGKME